jgi:hypothetical protein
MRQRLAQVAERMKATAGAGAEVPSGSPIIRGPGREFLPYSVNTAKNSLFLDSIDGRLPPIPTGVLVVICTFEQSTKSVWRKA